MKLVESLGESSQRCPCYPDMCTASELMNAEEIGHHLEVMHGFSLADRLKGGKARRPLADVTNGESAKNKRKGKSRKND
jgi:hypothetical protein